MGNMGNWSSGIYIASQIITIFAFVVIGASYFTKKRSAILLIVIGANFLSIISFSLLSAWVGTAMSAIAIVRTVTLWLVDRKKSEEAKNRILPVDWVILVIFATIMLMATFFTSDGWLTWFGLLGTLTFTIALWQKNVFVYRLLGFISEIFWLIYNVVVGNFMGTILECVFALVILIGLFVYIKERKSFKNSLTNTPPLC